MSKCLKISDEMIEYAKQKKQQIKSTFESIIGHEISEEQLRALFFESLKEENSASPPIFSVLLKHAE